MKRRLISLLLMMSIVASYFAIPAFAAETNIETTTLNVGGEEITYSIYETETMRCVSYTENGVEHNAVNNFVSGQITFDGELVAVVEPVAPFTAMENGALMSTAAEYEWVYYQTSYSDVKSDILTVTAWTSILLALIGVNVPEIVDIAEEAVELLLPTIYYKCEQYYKSPVTTSRPQTANKYTFYSDAGYSIYIGTIDLRT